jgi:predicted methyltransferase
MTRGRSVSGRRVRAWRQAMACALGLVALSFAVAPGAVRAQAREPHGRLFPPADLAVLEGPDRDAWQQPGRIMDALGIADGSVVADIGAGGGWFTVRLARRVGPNGLVYAEDVQPQMIEAIQRRVEREGLGNVRTVLGRDEDPRLPAGSLDAALVVDAYHEVQDRVGLLRRLREALKPSGRVGIVDFRSDGGGPGPAAEDRVDPALVVTDAERAGLRFLAHERFLPYQYLLVFGP